MADVNTIQRIRQLEAERGKLLDTAKKEALGRARQAVADLNALGFSYTLGEGTRGGAPLRAKSSRKGTRTVKNAPCPICEFMTSPPHDARKHRFAQGKKKRPFTVQELADLGLKKVG